jgi:hypothetical protein
MDGPPGALALAFALQGIGKKVAGSPLSLIVSFLISSFSSLSLSISPLSFPSFFYVLSTPPLFLLLPSSLSSSPVLFDSSSVFFFALFITSMFHTSQWDKGVSPGRVRVYLLGGQGCISRWGKCKRLVRMPVVERTDCSAHLYFSWPHQPYCPPHTPMLLVRRLLCSVVPGG